jgi:hypothetical protein
LPVIEKIAMNRILGISRAACALWVLRICLCLHVTFGLRAADVNSVWTGGSGNWSVADNWNPNARYPNDGNGGRTYNVRVSSGTVTLTEPISIQQYTNNGNLAGQFPLTVNDLFTWTGGTLSDNAPLNALGGADLGGSTKTLEGRTLNVGGGTAMWSAGVINSGSGAALSVQPEAILDTDFDGTLSVSPAGTTVISNWGTFRKSGGIGTSGTTINALLYNQPEGLVQVTSGILNLRGGGASSGTFAISTNAMLSFSGGDYVLDSGSSVTGTGTNRVTAGSVGIAGVYDFASGSTLVSGGSLSFDGPNPNAGNLFPGHVYLSGGNLSFDSASPVLSLSGLSMSGGILQGSDSVEILDDMAWMGGTIQGSGVITPLSGMTLSGGGTKILLERTLSLPAKTTNIWLQGSLSSGLGAVFNLEPFSEFHNAFDGSYGVSSGGPATITNRGAFRKTDGTGVTSITPPFINIAPGVVEAASGILSLIGGGGGDGTYASRSGATLRFGGGEHNLSAESRIEGDGTNHVSTGTVVFNGEYDFNGDSLFTSGTTTFHGPVLNAGFLTLSGGPTVFFDTGMVVPATAVNLLSGTLTGGDTIEVSGPFTWSGGRLDGLGGFEVNGGAGFNGGTKTLMGRTLNLNSGTTHWSAGNISSSGGAVVNNASLFDVTFDGSFLGSTTFNNAGTVRKSGGTTTTTIVPMFNNTTSGLLEVQVGTMSFTGGGSSSGSFEIAEGAILAFSGGNHTLDAEATLTGPGTNTVTLGSLNVAGSYDVIGGTRVTGGTASFSGSIESIGAFTMSAGTVTFAGDGTIDALNATISGGTLNTEDRIDIAGEFNWTGGTLAGAGLIHANGPTTLSGSQRTLNGQLQLNAPTTWSAGNIRSGQGGSLTIDEFVLFDTTFDGAVLLSGGGTSVITNRGIFIKSGGFGAAGTAISSAFNNTLGATIEVASGILSLNGGGTSSGAFLVATNSTLQFSGGSNFLDNASSVGGAGGILFSTGNALVEGLVSVTGGLTVSGGTVRFTGPVTGPAPFTVSGGVATFDGPVTGGGTLSVNGGRANFNGASAIPLTAVTLSEGGIGGTSDLDLSEPFIWTGGTLGDSGTLTANAGATFANNSRTLSGRTVAIPGGQTASWTAGNFRAEKSGALDIAGTLDIAFDGQFITGLNDSAAITNSGMIRKSGGNGTATIGVTLDNNGVLEVNSGRLDLFGGGTGEGHFITAANTTLGFVSDTRGPAYHLGPGSSIAGPGDISLEGGTLHFGGTYDVTGNGTFSGSIVNFNPGARIQNIGTAPAISGATVAFDTGAPVGFPNLTLSAGSLGGTDTLDITNRFTWSGGTLNGNNVVNALGGALLDGGNRTLLTGSLNLFGESTWNAGNLTTGNETIVHIQTGATLINSFDGQLGGSAASSVVTNTGTFRKTGGSGATVFRSRLENLGIVEINSGRLDFSFAPYIQSAGSTILNGGDLIVGTGLEILGGSLSGIGTVTGLVTNAAIIDPGVPLGILRIDGELRLGPTAIVNFDLAGTIPGLDHDQVIVAPLQTVYLDGTLNVTRHDGFLPNVGDRFPILTFGSRIGQFTSFSGFDLGVSDRHLEAVYDEFGLTLVTRAGPLDTSATLSIQFLPPNTLALTWSDQFPGYNLHSTTNLFPPDWLPIGPSGTNEVFLMISPDEPERHFRLEKP